MILGLGMAMRIGWEISETKGFTHPVQIVFILVEEVLKKRTIFGLVPKGERERAHSVQVRPTALTMLSSEIRGIDRLKMTTSSIPRD